MLDNTVQGLPPRRHRSDALGRRGEHAPDPERIQTATRRAWRGTPNAGLRPEQFTDDTQMMLLVAWRCSPDGTYSENAYAAALARMHRTMNSGSRGVVSRGVTCLLLRRPTSGSPRTPPGVSIAIPFGLLQRTGRRHERVVRYRALPTPTGSPRRGDHRRAARPPRRPRPPERSRPCREACRPRMTPPLGSRVRAAVHPSQTRGSVSGALFGDRKRRHRLSDRSACLLPDDPDPRCCDPATTAAHVGGCYHRPHLRGLRGKWQPREIRSSAGPPWKGLRDGRDRLESVAAPAPRALHHKALRLYKRHPLFYGNCDYRCIRYTGGLLMRLLLHHPSAEVVAA